MNKTLITIIAIAAFVTGLALWTDTRIAAGAGALALLGVIIYGYISNKRASDATYRKAERNAREMRKS
ncbi:hypothetical protein [Aurantiacibacter sediminis]|uniref:Uncharacterized protein n=1 Tax=Aurantiacibacter sediminis TaxID=2793064 RepID=A0ABS0N1A5_9SPHN|nr:hypothetical protein [Aurantiacibacter sediminis]MBH5321748.1 hypothetical protein [Aurantiacibacter sediminis]